MVYYIGVDTSIEFGK